MYSITAAMDYDEQTKVRRPAADKLTGWAVGLLGGTWLAWSDGLKPLHAIAFGDLSFTVYTGLIALIANIVVAVVVNAATRPAMQVKSPVSP